MRAHGRFLGPICLAIVCCLPLVADSGCAPRRPDVQPRAPSSALTARRVGMKGGAEVFVALPFRLRSAFQTAVQDVAVAARVPIGFELAADRSGEYYPPSEAPISTKTVVLTGMTVQRALDTLTAIDRRYEWFETGGVINVRPKGARHDPDNYLNMLLSQAIGDLSDTTLDGIRQAYHVQYARLVGRSVAWHNPPPRPMTPPSDSTPQRVADFEWQRAFWNRTISISQKGPRFVDLLNAAIGAHGEACWRVEYKQPPASYENGTLWFNSFEGFGGGSGSFPPVGGSPEPASAARPAPAAPARADAARPQTPTLLRIVPDARINYPVGPWDAFVGAQHLATLTRTPIVVEWPRGKMQPPVERARDTLELTGMRLPDALTRIAREQPQLTWRNGRFGLEVMPGDAAFDPDDFLNVRVPNFELKNATYFDVFPALDRFFGIASSRATPRVPVPDQNTRTPEEAERMRRFYTRPITLTLENATVREILGAVAAAHGDLAWVISWVGDSRDYGSCFLSANGYSMPDAFSYRPGRGPHPADHAATYNAPMASVADDLRRASQLKVLELSPGERIALTERLAEADIDLYCATHGTSREEAKRVFVRQRQAGRRPSCVMQEASE